MENNNKEQESTGKTQLERFITFMNNNSLWPKNEIWQIEIDRFLTDLKREPATPPSIEGKQDEVEKDDVAGTFHFDHDKQEETYTPNPNFGKTKINSGKQEIKSKEEIFEQHIALALYPSERQQVYAAMEAYASQFTPIASKEVESDAIEFAEWIEKDYAMIHSEELEKSAWINCRENDVLVHGSDLHFTELINKAGKTTTELYKLFKEQNNGK